MFAMRQCEIQRIKSRNGGHSNAYCAQDIRLSTHQRDEVYLQKKISNAYYKSYEVGVRNFKILQ